jgi:hypothetical protein
MIKLAKDNLYISIVIVLAILKIAGIIDIGWIWVLVPIWWWWPIAIVIGVACILIIILEEVITYKGNNR